MIRLHGGVRRLGLLRKKKGTYAPDDDRSFAVALRLEMVAQRLAIINQELESQLAEKQEEDGKGGESD